MSKLEGALWGFRKVKNKISIITVLILFLLILVSCASTTQITEEKNTEGNIFYEFRSEINKERKDEYSKHYSYSDFNQYLKTVSSDRNALSSSEISRLKAGDGIQKSFLTYQEMEEDVNLFFNALRANYGAYYYWGGFERFDGLRLSVLEEFKGKRKIGRDELKIALTKATSFIIDGHFGIEGSNNLRGEEYWYYYVPEVCLEKTEEGFIWISPEEEIYSFLSCDNPEVTIERTLFPDGTLGYGLVQFVKQKDHHDTDVLYFEHNGQIGNMDIVWKESTPLHTKSQRNPGFLYLKQGKVTYIRLRSFDTKYVDQLEKFQDSGSAARNNSLLVFDLRSNGGGNNQYMNTWFEHLTGKQPDVKRAEGRRNGPLNDFKFSESYKVTKSQGTIVNRSGTVIILVDNQCGSSGESALNALKTLKNSIAIGTNSIGCETFGNQRGFYLPNSAIWFQYGTDIRCFSNTMENLDGKGFLPDIWADPITAHDAVEKMLIKYGIASPEDLKDLIASK